MASLVFSLSGGQTRAYAFESGDVNNLAQWDVTDDTARLEDTLTQMTVWKIEDALGHHKLLHAEGLQKPIGKAWHF